jgi:hypothetical protein
MHALHITYMQLQLYVQPLYSIQFILFPVYLNILYIYILLINR